MNIAPINKISNINFSSVYQDKSQFTEKQLESIEIHKDLLDALYCLGVIEKGSMMMINKALRQKELDKNMEYISDHIIHPDIKKVVTHEDVNVTHIEYDDFRYIHQDICLQDKQLEEALTFVRRNGGRREYDELNKIYENHIEHTSKEADMTKKLKQMEEDIKAHNPSELGNDTTTVESISTMNPYSSFRAVLTALEFAAK